MCCWPELHKHLQEWAHRGTFAINGPAVQHSESVETESMKKYWGGKKQVKDGHFVRKSMNIKSYFVSKAVDSLQNTQKKKPPHAVDFCNMYR